MLERLRSIDPESASRLHVADRKRIIRALEVYEETGETITSHNRRTQAIPSKYNPLWLGIDYCPRAALYDRIDRRVTLMLNHGLIDEIKGLLESGISEKCTSMQAIGYKEFVDAINGRCTLEEAAACVRQSSRHYANRQLTWFRRNKAIHWLIRHPEDRDEMIISQAKQIIYESNS